MNIVYKNVLKKKIIIIVGNLLPLEWVLAQTVSTFSFSCITCQINITYITALQIRAGQRSITANLRTLTAHIYHVMIIEAGGFFKKSFLILLFPRNSFEGF